MVREPGEQKMNERVLISGASIAGPTVAYWLARFGFRPTVVERAPALRAGGNGVDLRDQALSVVERMGVLPAVLAAANDIQGVRFLNAVGRPVASVDFKAIANKYGATGVEIRRGALAEVLYKATKDDVEYVFGDSITAIDQDSDGVGVRFQQGAERRFDLVVGADGTHSAVRRLAFGPEADFLHYLGHYFAFTAADPALAEPCWVSLYNEPGRSIALDRPGNRPGATVTFGFYRRDPLAYDYRDVDAQKCLVADAFAGVGWHGRELLAGALADPNFYFDALAQVRMPSWSTGRVTLAGDAAHCASPVAGAGAELALVGAYRLAGEVAAAGGDHQRGFAGYERAHRPTVKRAQSNLFVGVTSPRTRAGIWLRNTMARLPLLSAAAGIENRMRPKTDPLPEYSSAASSA
jgi:2-polyprenyl-6-methoxyphenol hydroxylase-like FAD-dependent oxidoreductase